MKASYGRWVSPLRTAGQPPSGLNLHPARCQYPSGLYLTITLHRPAELIPPFSSSIVQHRADTLTAKVEWSSDVLSSISAESRDTQRHGVARCQDVGCGAGILGRQGGHKCPGADVCCQDAPPCSHMAGLHPRAWLLRWKAFSVQGLQAGGICCRVSEMQHTRQ